MNSEMRVPPHDVLAEQNVLGGLMLAPHKLDDVADWLAPSDFYEGVHQAIYRAIRELADKRKPFDAVTLGEWFESNGMGEQVDRGAYLVDLSASVFSAANLVAYAEIVRDKAVLRQLVDVGGDLIGDAFEPKGRSVAEIVDAAQSRFVEMQPRQRGGLVRAGDSLGAFLEDMQRRHETGDRITGIPTPWKDINEATHGIQRGELTIVAARPSMGKSIFGLNLALFSAMRGLRVAFFSLEMSRMQCNRRNTASLARVPHDWLLSPQGGEEEYWSRMTSAIRDMKNMPLFIDDTPSLNVRQFEARAKRLHRSEPLDLIVTDHFHDFEIDPKLARFELGRIAQAHKNLAKEWNIPVVGLCQLNRNVTGRTEKRPTLGDLRESGELEQKGDLILFLHREDYYDTPGQQTHLQGVVEVHIAKGRDIQAGQRITLRNEFDQVRLADWEGPLPREPEAHQTTQRRKTTDRWSVAVNA